MRDCWIQHDKCTANCPCNEECPDGCPNPHEGHSCDTWFCQGYFIGCAAIDDPNREECGTNVTGPDSCRAAGCCWAEYWGPGPGTYWCHQPKKQPI